MLSDFFIAFIQFLPCLGLIPVSYEMQETDEARKKFSNAKSISSAQFFGEQNKAADVDAQVTLSKFSVCALIICNLLKNCQTTCF